MKYSERARREKKRADLNMAIAFCYETIERARKKLAKLDRELSKEQSDER